MGIEETAIFRNGDRKVIEIATVESIWRYPIKSMRGHCVDEGFIGFSGLYGDRWYALRSSKSPSAFPYFTGRELRELLLFEPRFLPPDEARLPVNWREAKRAGPGVNPTYVSLDELATEVVSPDGQRYAWDDPALLGALEAAVGRGHELSWVRSERGLTDCRPLSLISLQTCRQLSSEMGTDIDSRRFRANLYLDLSGNAPGSDQGFKEDQFVGRSIQVGDDARLAILERDPRCAMITLDPDTAASDPAVLRHVAKRHEGMAGVYGAVLSEGIVRRGDSVHLLD